MKSILQISGTPDYVYIHVVIFYIIIIKDLQKVAKKCTGKFYALFP